MPWDGRHGYARWSLRFTLVPFWRTATRWFVRVSVGYFIAALLSLAAFEGDLSFFRLSVPEEGSVTAILGVCASWALASWAVWATGFVLVSLAASGSKRLMGDRRTELIDPDTRKSGTAGASATGLAVASSVWTGPVRFLRRSRFAWNNRSWPPSELLTLMSTEDPLVAPDGSGVWYHAASGYSVVLTRTGLVTWIERRDIRPDLLRYMERGRRDTGART